ncbi:hypothetical protein OHR86_32600 [Streptomyces sp. NBC_00441]|uniref:hypothetical protein n=1 Tax=Streptomyces sp. NBC_00441 TaxID=2975742 RepID=UPI002E28FEF7|nr:hypothetical protein [Streptomyces sp. NBC_00441]
MDASELATAAVRVMTGDGPAASGRKSAVQELVWGRLGRSDLGASALRRLHEQPGEGSAAIVASVLTDDLRADADLRAKLDAALRVPPRRAEAPVATSREPAGAPAAATPPPPVAAATPGIRGRAASGAPSQPSRPAGAQARPEDTVRSVLMVWLLGLPQAILAYVIISVDARHGTRAPLQYAILVTSACVAGYALRSGIRLLRRGAPNPSLRAATFLAALVLLRYALWVFVG